MHEVLQALSYNRTTSLKPCNIAEIAKNIREEVFAHGSFKFSGSFPRNWQNTSVPYNLIAMILDRIGSNANHMPYPMSHRQALLKSGDKI